MTYVLTLICLLSLSSCASTQKCEPDIRYKTEVITMTPVISEPDPVEPPSRKIGKWKNHKLYRIQCEAKIQECNTKASGLYRSIEEQILDFKALELKETK